MLVSKSASLTQQLTSPNASKEDSLERKILAMSSLDLAVAMQSMNNIENVSAYNIPSFKLKSCPTRVCMQSKIVLQLIKSHQVLSLQSKEDKFIGSINMQLKLLQTYPLQQGGTIDVHKGFRTTFMVILAVRIFI